MPQLRMAVIGVGHLGKEHARILASLPEVELVGVADVNLEQAQAVALRCNTQAYSDYWPLLNLVDAATIAVPTCYHHQVASEFLRRGIPVLVEKPLAGTLAHAQELVQLSKQHQAILQVGHIERFNPIMLELETKPLQPKYIEGHRQGGFTGRSLDIGVVLDLMIHDLDLVLALVRSPVVSVEAMGVSLLGGQEDLANARITFANGCVANLSASRMSQRPSRKMRIFAPEGYASIDFANRHATLIQPSEQARTLRQRFDPRKLDAKTLGLLKERLFTDLLQVRDIDLKAVDQLTLELQHFVQCVQTGTQPKVTGEDGLKAVELASQVLDRIARHPWEGQAAGAVGPRDLPAALGMLFEAQRLQEEAA